jgi:hypothetical protein
MLAVLTLTADMATPYTVVILFIVVAYKKKYAKFDSRKINKVSPSLCFSQTSSSMPTVG